MNYVGIDIGSTAAKTLVLDGERVAASAHQLSSRNCRRIKAKLWNRDLMSSRGRSKPLPPAMRVAVDYADKVLTEITCHGRGGSYLFPEDCVIIDVGGGIPKSSLLKRCCGPF